MTLNPPFVQGRALSKPRNNGATLVPSDPYEPAGRLATKRTKQMSGAPVRICAL
jgi:hypothetical protein